MIVKVKGFRWMTHAAWETGSQSIIMNSAEMMPNFQNEENQQRNLLASHDTYLLTHQKSQQDQQRTLQSEIAILGRRLTR